MSLDPQAEALLKNMEESGAPPFNKVSPAEARLMYDQGSELVRGDPPEPHSIENIDIPGKDGKIAAWVYRPSESKNLPTVVFFHGGGFVIGSLKSHDTVCRSLCIEAQCLVISIDYRLAPENKYPAALDDAWTATTWIANNIESLGGDANHLAVAGDSAGGCLAASVSLLAKESGSPDICKQILVYPCTDMSARFDSHREFGDGYRLTSELLEWFYNHYFSEKDDIMHWKATPLNAQDFTQLPPTFIISAGFDPLQDEAKAYAEKLKNAGVQVKFSHYEGMMHGFITMPGVIDKAKQALSECAEELKNVFY